MDKVTSISAAAAAGLLLACSADPEAVLQAGFRELHSGRPEQARADFEAALAELEPRDRGYLEARLGNLAAQCFSSTAQPKDEFLALVREFPDRIGEPEFLDMSTWLVSARRYEEALALIDDGLRVAGGAGVRLAAHRELVSAEEKRNRPVLGELRFLCEYGAPDKP